MHFEPFALGLLSLIVFLLTFGTRRLLRLNRALKQETERTHAWIRRFQMAEEAAELGIWEYAPSDKNALLNDRVEAQIGYEKGEVGGPEKWIALVHPEDREKTAALWESLSTRPFGHFKGENRIRCKDGSYRWLLFRGISESDGQGGVRVIGANIDIHEKKEAERRLARLAEELKKSNTELERFAYVASHDLKEPLRMISTYLGLLKRKVEGKLDPQDIEYIGYALEGAQRLNNQVDALLRFSRLGQMTSNFERVSLDKIATDALAGLDQAVREAGAGVQIDTLGMAWGDPAQLTLVFQNLASNALKFKHPERAPRIRIYSHVHDEEVETVVEDNGLGISPTDQTKIFEIFQRLHRRSEYPGEGIGLASCKKIIEAHGGRIWVTSEPGVGSRFRFSLQKQAPAS